MKVAKFIAYKGWDWAKELTIKHENCYMPKTFNYWSNKLQDFVLCTKYASFEVSELKQYVDAWEFVQKKGGLTVAKRWLQTEESEPYYNYEQSVVDELKKNIALVEEVESLKEVC